MSVVDEIFELFNARGSAAYGESVTMTQHALQAAHFAKLQNAPPRLVVAALLHDIGHLVVVTPDDIDEWTEDARHEELGGQWLAKRFGPAISESVRLHVPAKRYLCAIDPSYLQKLSSASVITLKLQGGPMSREETARFETEPFYREAIRVREWDDLGKVAGLQTAELGSYRSLIEAELT